MTRAIRATPSETPIPTPSLTPELLLAGCVVAAAEAVVDVVVAVKGRAVEVEVAMVLEAEVVLKTSKSNFRAVPFPGCCWQLSDIAFKSRFSIQSLARSH